LRVHELVRRLAAVAHRQRRVHVEVAGLRGPRDQFVDGDLAEHVAGTLGLPQVTADQAAVGAADASNRLAGGKVHHLVDVHAAVRLSPAVDRKGEHRHVPRSEIRASAGQARGRNNLIGNASRGL
jgi:hypothetical protein